MKKIIILSILLITIISAFYNCLAFEIGEKELKSLGSCEVYLNYDGAPKYSSYIVYQKDGKNYPAYCMDPDFHGIGSGGYGDYNVIVNDKITNEKVWRAIINGYPYKTISELGTANEKEAFVATKFASYVAMGYSDINKFEPVNSEAGRRTYQAMLKIVNSANSSTEKLENNVQISITPKEQGWKIDNINKQCVSKIYTLNSSIKGECNVNVEENITQNFKLTDINNKEKSKFLIGEEFKVLIPIKELLENGKFTIKASRTVNSKPVLYGKTTIPLTQSYAIAGYMSEDSKGEYKDNYLKNITRLIILKKEDGSEKRLKDVKFNLLDENKNIISNNLVTNDNGEIILENIVPGKYYISEVETLEGYNLYTDLIEVNLDFNEEFQVIVNNSLKEKTEIDKKYENVEVTSKYTETAYNVENNNTLKKDNTIKKLPVTGY